MDDANVPSLLSMPYLGYCKKEDTLYQHTRSFILSHHNPYYYQGTCASGIGSPHTPKNYIWHMILETSNNEGLCHEEFNKDEPSEYTRSWFAWANSLFAELVYQTYFVK